MKFAVNKKYAVLAAVNAVLLGTAAILSCIASAEAKSHTYNYAAERWASGGDYTQISCFFSENAGFTMDSVASARMQMLSNLKNVSIVPEEGQKLCPDGWSASLGQASIKGDLSGRSEAEITAVGGDYFLIHDFRLLDGAFFSDDDIMQDGIVIDKNLAWSLYGSNDIAGMTLTVNGSEFYISGVIDTPSTDEERECAGELPRAYVSYDGASLFASESEGFMGEGASALPSAFRKVTCYEVIMPDPVENYAYESMKGYFEGYGKNAEVIRNTGRFAASKRLKALKNMKKLAVRDSAVIYPYRENASRLAEYKLSYLYMWRIICLIIPAVTAVWIIVRCAKLGKKYIIKGVNSVLDFIEKRKMMKWREKNEKKEA
ncbi:MAG: ABC transporter permease [Ruminococcus sp.]|nr:ABC transporter permease [Ruminococcus sp.]